MRLIISVLLLVAGVAVLFFWGRTLWQDIQKLQVERSAYESVLSRLNELKKTRDTLLTSYNSTSAADIKRIKNFLPDTPNTGPLVVQMANITNESGLLLKNINIGISTEKSMEVPLLLSVSGSYQNFIGFLQKLEKSLRLIDVVKLSFSSSREDFYDFSLEAKSYIQK
ncbi:MAG: type 4a pilus biogenesis protein PilO [Patescibacteria group bacterium]